MLQHQPRSHHPQPAHVSGSRIDRDLLTRLRRARRASDALFELVREEALYERPIAERHRLVFYIGHLEAFDWNLIARRGFELAPFNEALDQLFAFGIDPVGGGLPTDAASDWPSLRAVQAYVRRSRELLDPLLATQRWVDRDTDPTQLMHVAIEHRLMHAETLVYLLHQLPLEQKKAPPVPPRHEPWPEPRAPRPVPLDGGEVTLGVRLDARTPFAWDNELGESVASVPAFAMDSHKVTNGEYLAFVRAGGYEDDSLWQPDDAAWRKRRGTTHPCFWVPDGDGFLLRRMFDLVPLPLAWPVYVSLAEARAYARWAGRSLPTEAEWHRAAFGSRQSGERPHPWGHAPSSPERGNFGAVRWDPTPVGAHPRGVTPEGIDELVGNGWEWTETPFAPLPGFRPFPFYPGYSANFFDGQHFVIKGASPRTGYPLARRSFRNWFQPHYPYLYAGFRLVQR